MSKSIFFGFILLVFCCGCSGRAPIKQSRPYLGTVVEITVSNQDLSRGQINKIIQKAFAEIERVEALLSRFNLTSDISRINADAGNSPTRVSQETLDLIKKARQLSETTNGAFDITVLPLLKAWKFDSKDKKQAPDPGEITRALINVGHQKVDIREDQQSVFLTQAGMGLDLGAIAKGYAVDRAIALLRDSGIKRALVNAGGDIYCLGGIDQDKPWQVAIQQPYKHSAEFAVLALKDHAVATSGNYQKYIEIEDKRLGHIIDPRTGFPCSGRAVSVTILAEDCLSADALATAVFVLGPQEGLALVEQLSNIEAIVITAEGERLNTLFSQGLKGKLEFNQ